LRTTREDGRETLAWYWDVIWGRKLVVLGLLLAGVLAAAGLGMVLTPIYRATALIMVEDEATRLVGMQGLYQTDLSQDTYYRTQVRLLRSRPILLAAAAQLKREGWDGSKTDEALAAELAGSVQVRHVAGTKLIEVSFESPERRKVARAATAIVECFEKESARWRRDSSEHAAGWLEEQLPRLRTELVAAEERLQAFQEENSILLLDGVQNVVVQRLSQLNQDFTAAELARIGLEAELRAAGESPETVEFSPRIAGLGSVAQLDSQILALEKEKSDLLRTMQRDHPQVRTVDSQLADLRSARRAKIEAAMEALRRSVSAAREKEKVLRSALDEQEKKALALNEKLLKLEALKREVERAKQLYEPLLETRGRLGLASGLSPPVQIVERAEEPREPVKPRRMFILAAGALLGLIAGVRLAISLERSHGGVRSAEELAAASGSKVLGSVPHMLQEEPRKRALACHLDPRSLGAEAYRCVRTGLLASLNPSGAAVLLVTSALDKEGKTTTASNIASAMAQAGRRVLLVEADLRRSSLRGIFGLPEDRGLSACLTDGLAPEEVVADIGFPEMRVVPAGRSPENPAELLGSGRMSEFLAWARKHYDFIVLDTPPVSVVTDASVLAPLADGAILVVRADTTPRRAISHAGEAIEAAKGKVVGVLLNDVPVARGRYGYGRYHYGYYAHRVGHEAPKASTASG